MIGRNGDYVFLDEKRHIILDSVGDAANFALQPVSSGTQSAVAGGTTDKTGNALIHSTKKGWFAPPATVHQPSRAFSEDVPCFTSHRANANFLQFGEYLFSEVFDLKTTRSNSPFALPVIPIPQRDLPVVQPDTQRRKRETD